MRESAIEKVAELAKLETLSALKDLNILGNPVAEEVGDGLKKEVLVAGPKFRFIKFNKEELGEDEIAEAEEERKERARKAEEDRLAAEAAAKEKADEEAAAKAEADAAAKEAADAEAAAKAEADAAAKDDDE